MKLEKNTLEGLKIISSVNDGGYFSVAGGTNSAAATSVAGDMYVSVDFHQSFDSDLFLLNLREFCNAASRFPDADLQFTSDYVKFKQGNFSNKIQFSFKKEVTQVRNIEHNMMLKFGLTNQEFSSMISVASAQDLNHLRIKYENDKVTLRFANGDDFETGNDLEYIVEKFEKSDELVGDFEVFYSLEHLSRIYSSDYNLIVRKNNTLLFETTEVNKNVVVSIKYLIGAVVK